jgi:predicted lysophospholipase L1 biosynthesis ABC-type transport system permease subunit
MKKEQDYIQDIAEIRSMMERSSKFLSLSGWTGILAGIYALAGAYIAWKVFDFNSGEILYNPGIRTSELTYVILLAAIVLLLALGTAIYESYRKAKIKGEKAWNPTSRRLLINMAVPLVTGEFWY